jgi:hypothetical protein
MQGDGFMSGERGTLPRGAPSTAQDAGPRARPAEPPSRRAPRAPREHKALLAALGVLLVIGGALATAYLVTQNDHRIAAVEVTKPLGVGERIPLSALHEVQIAPSAGLAYVPWDEASQVTRFYAATGIPDGTLLTSAMVAGTDPMAVGRSVIGLVLKDGHLPDGLQAGDHVNLYEVSAARQSCPGTPGRVIASNAIVLAVNAHAAGDLSDADVRVAVDPAAAGAVTCNAVNNDVAVAVLPGSATGGAG